MARNPLCVDCLNPDPLASKQAFNPQQSRVTPATDVHHIEKLSDAPERKYDEANLMALCGECHDSRTAKGE